MLHGSARWGLFSVAARVRSLTHISSVRALLAPVARTQSVGVGGMLKQRISFVDNKPDPEIRENLAVCGQYEAGATQVKTSRRKEAQSSSRSAPITSERAGMSYILI